MDVADHGIKRFSRNGIVLAGAELCREAAVQDGLPGDLGGDGDAEGHPGELENPPQNVEVPNREDEGDDGGIGKGRSPWELSAPARALTNAGPRDIRGLFHDRSSEKNEW